MKKKIILLSLLVIITAGLGVGIMLLSNDLENTDDTNPNLVILNLDDADISSIGMENEYGKHTASFYGESEATRNLKLDIYKDIPSHDGSCKNLLNNVKSLTALRNFGENTKNTDYGFDTPFAVLTVKMTDNTQKVVTFGNESPDKSGRYATLSGNSSVFLVENSVANIFSQDPQNFISLNLFGVYTDEEAMSVKQIVLGGSCREQEITVQNDKSEYSARIFKISEPVKSFANDENVAQFCTMLTLTYSAEAIEVLNPDEKTLAEYGFDNPYSTVKFVFEGKEEKIVFGKEAKDGKLYAMVNDIPAIYRLNAEDYSFIGYQLPSLRDTALFSCIIKYVDSISVTADGKTNLFKADGESVTLNGKSSDYREYKDYYSTFLQSLSKSHNEGCSDKAEKLCEVKITFNYDRTPESFVYYKEKDSYFVSVNGAEAVKLNVDYARNFLQKNF